MNHDGTEHDPTAIVLQVLDRWKAVAWDREEATRLDLRTVAQAFSARVRLVRTANDAAEIIAAVLRTTFPHRQDRFNPYTCASVASRIYRDLRAAGLLQESDGTADEDAMR